jgi:hypothetical protein
MAVAGKFLFLCEEAQNRPIVEDFAVEAVAVA